MNNPPTIGLPTIGLLGIGSYLPERIMTNEEWAALVDTSDDWIVRRTGIERRRIAAPEESTADLAVHAARAALADAGLEARDIDEIIVASDTPEVYIPDTASFVQHRLGAREVPAYDLGGSGCAGFVLGLDVARSRVGRSEKKILVIGVEVLSRLVDPTDRATAVLFGDGAAAAVVGRVVDRGGMPILAATAGTDGGMTEILSCPVGGTRLPFTVERGERREHQKLIMNGREVFKHAVKRMCAASVEVLEQAGIAMSDVDLVIPHQANLRIIQAVGEHLKLPEEKLFINIQDFGNTGSASVPIALCQARDAGRLRAGDTVLLTAFGAGFHWAAVLLRISPRDVTDPRDVTPGTWQQGLK